VDNQLKLLEGQYLELSSMISNAYINQKEIPYYLHSIIIHDGYADVGHYYSFIFDRAGNNWYRFNDHTVSLETEQTVFQEAIGGPHTSKCAYALIYINEQTAK
jgi:hypothetical protein